MKHSLGSTSPAIIVEIASDSSRHSHPVPAFLDADRNSDSRNICYLVMDSNGPAAMERGSRGDGQPAGYNSTCSVAGLSNPEHFKTKQNQKHLGQIYIAIYTQWDWFGYSLIRELWLKKIINCDTISSLDSSSMDYPKQMVLNATWKAFFFFKAFQIVHLYPPLIENSSVNHFPNWKVFS